MIRVKLLLLVVTFVLCPLLVSCAGEGEAVSGSSSPTANVSQPAGVPMNEPDQTVPPSDGELEPSKGADEENEEEGAVNRPGSSPDSSASPTTPPGEQNEPSQQPNPTADTPSSTPDNPDSIPSYSTTQPPESSPAATASETPSTRPLASLPEGQTVEDSWFSDAVFLGDSRTDGLRLYSGIKGASFLSYKGLSVFTIDDKKCIDLDGKKVTVLDALAQVECSKVYIMLGINEMGYQNTSAFKQAYLDLVDQIQEMKPEADIYIQTLLPVNEELVKEKGMADYINNERVSLFNDLIAQVAEEEGAALVDVWECVATENGSISDDLTSDGVHLKRAGYERWYAYLRTHTGTEPETSAVAIEQNLS